MKKVLIVKASLISLLFIGWMVFTLTSSFLYPDKGIARENVKYNYTRAYNVKKKVNELSGINLGGAIQAKNQGYLELPLEEKDFEVVKRAGFRYVRIPFSFLSSDIQFQGENKIHESVLSRLDWVIENSLSRELKVIIIPHYAEANNEFMYYKHIRRDDCEEEILLIWDSLSNRYKNYSEDLWFEMGNSNIEKALAIIRGTGGINIRRNIVVGVRNHINGAKKLKLPSFEEDPNIIITFHYYKPVPFTFQGENYTRQNHSSTHFWLGNRWNNTPKQMSFIRKDFDVISKWAIRHNRKVILGEFGVSEFADLESQMKWTRFVVEEAEKRGMTWIYWQLHDATTFGGVYNQKEGFWKKEIIDVLQPEDSKGFAINISEIDKLLLELKSSQWEVRQEAVLNIKKYAPLGSNVVPYLIKALGDDQWQVRNAAIQALGRFGELAHGAIPNLIRFLNDEKWELRNSATIALYHFGEQSKPALNMLIENLSHDEWVLRRSTAKTLSVIGPDAKIAIPHLIENCWHGSWLVRDASFEALATIAPNNKEVKQCLKEGLDDPDPSVSKTARVMLKRF